MSFQKLKLFAQLGLLPKRISNARISKCACYLFGAMTRKGYRTQAQPEKLKKATRPGQVVSVDQVESSAPGLVAQLKGRLTKQQYKYATVFVDHYSRYGYVYIQRTLSAEETLKAKQAFEAQSQHLGVTIENYHADN